MDRVGVGRAKLILFGEHAAVYGFPSLGLGLPAATEIRIRASVRDGWSYPSLPAGEAARFAEFLASISELFPESAREGGEIRVASTVPRGLGFGSSAALCVAFARALAGDGGEPERIWSVAHRAERFFHGRPSGIDTGLSLLGGLRCFGPSRQALPETRLLRGAPLHLVVGAVPRLVEELGAIASRAIELMEARGPDDEAALGELGALLGAAHVALGRLGLGDPAIDLLIRAGMELGAVGGKQSGSGSGGAFFLLFRSREAASSAALALADLSRARGVGLAAPLLAIESARIEEEPDYPLQWPPRSRYPRSDNDGEGPERRAPGGDGAGRRGRGAGR
jgi:mevalonate kinase